MQKINSKLTILAICSLLSFYAAAQTQAIKPVNNVDAPAQPGLTYKAEGEPITVEDLRSMQSRTLQDDFYRKAGFTTVRPVVQKTVKPSLSARLKPVPPSEIIEVVGIFRNSVGTSADIRVGDSVFTVSPSESVNKSQIPFKVISITDSSLLISYSSLKKSNKAKSVSIKTGQAVEISL